MRELIFSDAFHIARIAKKIGVARIIEVQRMAMNEFTLIKGKYDLTNEDEKELFDIEIKEAEERVGLQIADVLISGFSEAESEIIAFYSAITGDKIEEVKKYSIEKSIDVFKEFIAVNGKERLLGFFTKAML